MVNNMKDTIDNMAKHIIPYNNLKYRNEPDEPKNKQINDIMKQLSEMSNKLLDLYLLLFKRENKRNDNEKNDYDNDITELNNKINQLTEYLILIIEKLKKRIIKL